MCRVRHDGSASHGAKRLAVLNDKRAALMIVSPAYELAEVSVIKPVPSFTTLVAAGNGGAGYRVSFVPLANRTLPGLNPAACTATATDEPVSLKTTCHRCRTGPHFPHCPVVTVLSHTPGFAGSLPFQVTVV